MDIIADYMEHVKYRHNSDAITIEAFRVPYTVQIESTQSAWPPEPITNQPVQIEIEPKLKCPWSECAAGRINWPPMNRCCNVAPALCS